MVTTPFLEVLQPMVFSHRRRADAELGLMAMRIDTGEGVGLFLAEVCFIRYVGKGLKVRRFSPKTEPSKAYVCPRPR